jgi:GT2 family glycosyltransferase
LKTSIIIPVWNQLAYTQQCLEAVNAFTPEEHEVILVDNASSDGTTDWIKGELPKHPDYKLIINDKNLGAGGATNRGIVASTGEYLCLLNNDVVVSKEWLAGLIDALEIAPDIGMVGPRTNYVSGPQLVADQNGYDSLFKYQIFAENYRKAHKKLYTPFWRIIPFCGLVKRSAMDQIGHYDEQFFPGNYGDDDICLRLCMAGYRNLICGDVFVHHHGSISMKDIDFTQNMADCKKKFEAKWVKPKSISAVMIVKNEGNNIVDCLRNLQGIVDEIVVVDTGSTDGTKAQITGDVKLYDFEWCDDFAAARNFANSKATKDWIFSIDADEVITGLDKITLFPFHAYRIVTRNYNSNPRWAGNTENTGEYPNHEKGFRWFPSTKVRLFPNDKRIQWEYPVHEVVENSIRYYGMQETECPEVIVHHYGRMNDNYEYGRGDKYYNLLHKQLASGKNDLRSYEQLAMQAAAMRKFQEARDLWDKVLAIKPGDSQALLNIGHCHAEEGRWKEALEWSRKALESSPDSKEAAMNTATCECMAGDITVAEKMCQDLILKYPDYPLPQGLLSALEINKGGKEDDRS